MLPDWTKYNKRKRRYWIFVDHCSVTGECNDDGRYGGDIAAAAEDRHERLNLARPLDSSFFVAEIDHEDEALVTRGAGERKWSFRSVHCDGPGLTGEDAVGREVSPANLRPRRPVLRQRTWAADVQDQ